MAKSTLPAFVLTAVANARKAQLSMLATLAVYVHATPGATEGLAVTLFKADPSRSEKSWANMASAVVALASDTGAAYVKLEALAPTLTPENRVEQFFHWVNEQLTRKGYNSSPEDVTNWVKGRASIKAKAKALADAERANKAAQAKQDDENKKAAAIIAADALVAAQASAKEAQADTEARVTSIADEKATQADASPTTDESAPIADAVQAPMIAPLLIVRRKGDTLDIEFGADISDEEIQAIIDALQAQITPKSEMTFPVLDLETAEG